MRSMNWIGAALLSLLASAALAESIPGNWDGLVEVKSKRLDAAYLLPGADFRPYAKVMIDPTEVAFKKDWMKDINRTRNLSGRVTEEHAAEILAAARSNFDDIFHEAFTKAGYQVVTTPGPDVLRVSTGVANLYINAPDTMSAGRSRSYTANAGEATLIIELRDSSTNALLGRVLDRRETREGAGMQVTNSITNKSDFRVLFKNWASISVKGLESLKAASPVPDPLEPGQKLN